MIEKRIKLLVISGSLKGGGAERQISYLAKYINKDKYEIMLCLFEKKGAYLEDIPKDIHIFDLCANGNISSPSLIFGLRKIIQKERPDIVFSNLLGSNVKTALAVKTLWRKKRPKLVLGVQNDPLNYRKQSLRLLKIIYPLADIIVACSQGMKNYFTSKVKIRKEKLKLIHNSVDINKVRELAKEPVEHRWFGNGLPILISVASLTPQKGYPYLLEAFKKLNKDSPSYLLIIGEGSERERLEALTTKLGISERVDFLGFQSNPFKYMVRADIFVLSSLWEGFGNVIIEAMVVGTPVIATDAPYGPRDIIKDRVNGLLVKPGDPEELTEKISFLLNNKEIRDKLAEEGLKRAQEQFDVNKMIHAYEAVFTKPD